MENPEVGTEPKADHRPDVYIEQRPYVEGEGRVNQYVFRASSLGGCIGSLVRTGLGITPAEYPEHIRKAFNDGVKYEPIIIQMLAEKGWKLLDGLELEQYGTVDETGQVLVEIKVGNGAVVRCHPDGIVQRFKVEEGEEGEIGERRVLEVKFLAESFQWEGFGPYDWQHSVEMVGTKLPGLYVVGRKVRNEEGELVGIREDLEITRIDTPKHSLGEIKSRVRKVVKLIDGREIPPCDVKMFPCGFWAEHDKVEGLWAEPDRNKITGSEFELAAKVWEAAKREFDGAKADMDLARTKLLGCIDSAVGIDTTAGFEGEVEGTEVLIRRKKGAARFNKTKAKKDGVDVDKYTEPSDDYWEVRLT